MGRGLILSLGSIALLSSPPLQAADGPASKLGEGAQRLVVPALSQAQSNWRSDACLVKIEILLLKLMSRVGPGKVKWFFQNIFSFEFEAPGAEKALVLTRLEALGLGPESPSSSLEFSQSTLQAPVRRRCLTEMSVDSGEALERAGEHGVPIMLPPELPSSKSEYYGYSLTLAPAGKRSKDPAAAIWSVYYARHRGTHVSDSGDGVEIDAKTGKLITGGRRAKPR